MLETRPGLLALPVVMLVAADVASVSRLGQQNADAGRVYTIAGQTRGDPGTLIVHDLSSGAAREFYNPGNEAILDVRVSPSGEWIAVRTRLLKFGVTPQETTAVIAGGTRVMEKSTLRVLNSRGAQIDAIPQGTQFDWSPDGRHLAYLAGEYRGIYSEYGNTKAWIWDLASRRRWLIGDVGNDVVWAKFDNNVYIWDRVEGKPSQVLRYDPSASRLETTPHVSVYFSPTGTYYYHPGPSRGSGRENVYLRATDVGLSDASPVLANLDGWRPLGWAPDADLLLMEVSRKTGDPLKDERAVIVYNPRQDNSVDIASHVQVVGWGDTSEDLIVRMANRIERRSLATLKQPSAR